MKKSESSTFFDAAFTSRLTCIQCAQEYPLDQILYLCPKEECQGLLEVSHDIQALKKYSASKWKEAMRQNLSRKDFPFGSGVWNKKEWVLPQIKTEHIVSLGEGNTPLLALESLAEELKIRAVWLKQCGISHTGSFKDLGMTVLVSHVKSLLAQGKAIRAVVCASTGDTSAALSAYAAYAGIPTMVILPAGGISTAQLVQPLASGSLLLSLKTDFDGCMRIIKELSKSQDIYLANSMNPIRLEGQKTMGIEVLQQLDWEVPDWFIIPGGNLGNVSALASAMQLMRDLGLIPRLPRICVAQSALANPLYLSYQKKFQSYHPVNAQKTLASAIQIGDPVSYPRAVRALREVEGVVEQASEEELANAAARADRYGLFNDPHTGVALACLEKLCQRGEIQKTDRVVVISTAHGLKFAEFKSAYHEGQLALSAKHQNVALELEPDLEQIKRSMEAHIGKSISHAKLRE